MIISQLPELFVQRERALLGPRFDAMFSYPGQGAVRGASVNALRCTPQQFAALADFPLEASPFCASAFVVPQPDWKPGRHPYHHAGAFYAQEPSASAPAALLDVHPGMRVADLCAAPGGKSCLMAEMMQGTGRVQAWELHPHRADLIAAQVQRLGLENVRPMTRDALKHREELDGTMDIVLLDAPCSGLGVMSEKPDVKYRVTAQSVDELVQLQSNLLDAVCPYVKKGGTLVYSTCSVLKDENVRQAEKFLARHPEFELLPLPETIPASVRQYETTGLQLLPQRDGIEGFYMCRMRRKKA